MNREELVERVSDAELKSIALDFREGLLDGRPSLMMCAAVCYPLSSYLSALHGVSCRTHEFDAGECNHVWIETDDGRAIDPTLDQFNAWFPWKEYPKVFVGTVDEYASVWGGDKAMIKEATADKMPLFGQTLRWVVSQFEIRGP